MKRIIMIMLSVMLLLSTFFGGCSTSIAEGATDRVIRIYNWDEYIDENLIAEFEEEYGYTVEYATFGTNENMYNDLKINNTSYDLICPSEYMIIKMAREGMLKKLDHTKLEVYNENVSPYIKKNIFTDKITWEQDGEEVSLNDYATCYMWGTMGLTYSEDVDAEDMNSWESLWGTKYRNNFSLKDSVRDTLIIGVAYTFKDELDALSTRFDGGEFSMQEYNDAVQEIFDRITDKDYLKKIEENMVKLKDNAHSFEVDSGKVDLATDKIDIYFAWSGDAVYVMDEVGEDRPLRYSIPREGSNIWFDGFVIPKNCSNEEGAYEFLNFISTPKNAARNMEYIGYTSAIVGEGEFSIDYDEDEDGEIDDTVTYDGIKGWIQETYGFLTKEEYDELTAEEAEAFEPLNLNYLFNDGAESDEYIVYTDDFGGALTTQYPDLESIARCTVMKYLNDAELEMINDSWEIIKGETLKWWQIGVILGLIVVIVVAFLVLKSKKFTFSNIFVPKKRKYDYKVVKIEDVE